MHVQAKSVTVTVNDYTQADTFRAEIDYKQFPFDPRSIRALGVVIAMEDVGSNYHDDNAPNVIQPRFERESAEASNVIFQGFADEESIKFDESNRTVSIEGRDFTALLIDKRYLFGTLDVDKRVDLVLKDILSKSPDLAELRFESKIPDADLPVLGKFWNEKDKLSGKHNVSRDESYWDVIQNIANKAALIAYIELDKLVISKPRVLYSDKRIKRFVYGRNVKNIEIKRKIGRKKNFNIKVRSLTGDPSNPVIEAYLPAEASDSWSEETGIPNKEVKLPVLKSDGASGQKQEEQVAPVIAFLVADVNDKNHLIKTGEKIYEELGRQQIEGSFETADMMTVDSATNDDFKSEQLFDVLKLRNGTPISIKLDAKDMEAIADFSDAESMQNYLKARNYNTKLAGLLTETLRQKSSVFYTKSVSFELNETSGFKCKIEFINFINLPKNLGGG